MAAKASDFWIAPGQKIPLSWSPQARSRAAAVQSQSGHKTTRHRAGDEALMHAQSIFMFGDRRSAAAFWFGSLIVAIGVGLHLPMFLMARDMGYMLAGMPMDDGML